MDKEKLDAINEKAQAYKAQREKNKKVSAKVEKEVKEDKAKSPKAKVDNFAFLPKTHFFMRLIVPKLKTHRGAAKRFSFTGSGKIKRRKAFKNHILTKKNAKRKRGLGQAIAPDLS